MAALSDYLESGLLNHVFRGTTFSPPPAIAIALCSGVPQESDTGVNIEKGGNLWELPSGDGVIAIGYARQGLGNPKEVLEGGEINGDKKWNHTLDDINAGSGVIKNAQNILFEQATVDWGVVSGIAITDSEEYGEGNLLMYAELDNPRTIYTGDSVKFDVTTLQISFN